MEALSLPSQSIDLSVPHTIEENNSNLYKRLTNLFWDAVDFLPDVWNFAQNTVTLLKDHFLMIPTTLKTVVVGLASLNILVIPGGLAAFARALFKHLPTSGSHGGTTENLINIAYLTGAVTGVITIFLSGVHEIVQKWNIPMNEMMAWVDIIIPWICGLLRLSIFLELMEISQLSDLRYQLRQIMRPKMITEGEIHEILKKYDETPQAERERILQVKLSDKYTQAMKELRERKWLVKKTFNGTSGIAKSIDKIQSLLQSGEMEKIKKGNTKAKEFMDMFEARSISHMNWRLLGVAANIFAAAGMVVNITSITMPLFGMISASFYIAQAFVYKAGRTYIDEKVDPFIQRELE